MKLESSRLSQIVLLLLMLTSLLLHFNVFSKDLVGFHVWRQTQTQNTSISFAEEDVNILNPRRNERGNSDGIFRMEFPLSQWIASVGIRIFSNDVLVSRILNFFLSLLSFLGIYKLLRTLKATEFQSVAVSAFFLFAPVLYYHSLNPMPDNLALCFSIWGLRWIMIWYYQGGKTKLILGAVIIALASLVKLPFIIYYLIIFLLVLFNRTEKDSYRTLFGKLSILFLSLIPVIAWYAWVIPQWEGNGIVSGITNMNSEQRSNFLYYCFYHIRATLPELLVGFPVIPLLIMGIWMGLKNWKQYSLLKWTLLLCLLLLSGLMVFEMNMIEKVHDYYFMPFLPLLALILFIGVKHLTRPGQKLNFRKVVLVVIIISMPVYSYFRIQPRWEQSGFNPDLLKYKTELRAIVPDNALVLAGNDVSHHIFLYYIGKKGWVFENNWTNDQKIRKMTEEGCRYMFCDSRHVDQNPRIKELFGTKLAEYGSIYVYELKLPKSNN